MQAACMSPTEMNKGRTLQAEEDPSVQALELQDLKADVGNNLALV